MSANYQAIKRLSGRFFVAPSPGSPLKKMLEAIARFSVQVWIAANRFAGYALLNLIEDPAILAFAFC
ncbi:MAG: hypothetical protein IV101_17600 [Dechloromonas sp.]|uniref:hypothetical protein n=1 Tax=Dechloromonas sp. TaxID=1917218 RepID=UPI0027F8371D|nr:hypothetical protein [Dechloromonas sp.]MBT9522692.1 hypothetical protein [Dechloromonas sp.]